MQYDVCHAAYNRVNNSVMLGNILGRMLGPPFHSSRNERGAQHTTPITISFL